ncbi:MAG: ABC transporter permease, partial [Erysipelotrichaceae bacterium]|nr:ABC transporter permease [Erysipelotrichaceae bacterium]
MLKEKLAALNIRNMNAQQKHSLLRMAVSIAIGLGLATLLILLTSDKPMESLRYYFTAPLQNASYFSYWVQKTIPLIFTGTAVCIMFSANQFNLGLEGSFLFGGLVAAVINIYVTPNNPVLGIPLSLIAGALIGSLITFIPALLDRLFNASVMVTSLMMNYICLWFSTYLLFSHLKDPRSSKNSYNWAAKDPIMVLKLGKGNKQLTVYFSIIIALLVVILAWYFLYRTKTGYKLRTVGVNHNFAKY